MSDELNLEPTVAPPADERGMAPTLGGPGRLVQPWIAMRGSSGVWEPIAPMPKVEMTEDELREKIAEQDKKPAPGDPTKTFRITIQLGWAFPPEG